MSTLPSVGRHARAILDTLGVGSLLVLDRDPEAIAAAQGLMAQDPRVKAMKTPFGALESALAELGCKARWTAYCSILVCLRHSWTNPSEDSVS